MPLPDFTSEGLLPPGIHLASLAEVQSRFGAVSPARERQAELLRLVVEAARHYPTIKRVLVWGSFVTDKRDPNDLDYSIVVGVDHDDAAILREHQRFFTPLGARMYYGADKGFVVIQDVLLDAYVERIDFVTHARLGIPRGIVEIQVWGEYSLEAQ